MTASQPWVTVLRWVLALLFSLVAALSVPLGLTAQWAKQDILDTQGFVNLLEPLASSPSFQNRLASAAADGVSTAVAESDAATNLHSLAGSAAGLVDLLPFGTDLEGSVDDFSAQLADKVHDAVEEQALGFVRSATFPPLWDSTVAEVHDQVVATLSGSRETTTSPEGGAILTIQVGPLVQILRQTLTDQGQWWAKLIPDFEGRIEVARLQDLPTLQRYYDILANSQVWIILVGGAALLLALMLAPRRLLVVGFGSLAAFVTIFFLWSCVPGFGQTHLEVIADADAAAISQQVWGLLSAPLVTALETGAGIALVTAIVTLVAALVVYLRGRRVTTT